MPITGHAERSPTLGSHHRFAPTVPTVSERGIGTVLQFGLTAGGPDGGDVPALLDQVARAIRELGAVEVADIVFRPARDAGSAAMSVYFVRSD